jgi:hypothetical protein
VEEFVDEREVQRAREVRKEERGDSFGEEVESSELWVNRLTSVALVERDGCTKPVLLRPQKKKSMNIY